MRQSIILNVCQALTPFTLTSGKRRPKSFTILKERISKIEKLWIFGHHDGSVPDNLAKLFPRDWFTKDAKAYFIGCHTSELAEAFQKEVIPNGTTYGIDEFLAFDDRGRAYSTKNGPEKNYASDDNPEKYYPKLGMLVKAMHKFSRDCQK